MENKPTTYTYREMLHKYVAKMAELQRRGKNPYEYANTIPMRFRIAAVREFKALQPWMFIES